MQLTKEQIDGIEKHVKEFDDLWPYQADDMLELLRGYRAYLAEVEHHEAEAFKHEAKVAAWKAKRNRTLAEHFEQNANYHRSRLSALKKGAE